LSAVPADDKQHRTEYCIYITFNFYHIQVLARGNFPCQIKTNSTIMAAQGSTLDMSLFFGTMEQKQKFCHELLRLLKRYGCVKITNHSIPDEDVHKLFDMVGDTACLSLCHQTHD